MAVLSYREVLPRTFSHKFGESPTAERKFVATLDEPTSTQAIINAIGIGHGASHPEYPYLKMLEGSMTEQGRQHAEWTFRYEVPSQENLVQNPLARPDVWSFSTGGSQVPFLYYYHGTDNTDIRPVVNAAGDYIEGMTVLGSEVRATISGNRANYPLALAAEVTNAINSSTYLGGAAYTWQCNGITGQQATEIVNDVELRFWQITVELTYRIGGYVEKVPHIGWHYITGGSKTRCWVYQGEGPNKEKVDSSAPQALTEAGDLKYPGAEGVPDQLLRRPYPVANFASFFGTPPF